MDLSWQYIAGFFDGEGHITFSQNRLQAGIAQAGKIGYQTLAEIKTFLLSHGITSSLHGKIQILDHKPQYTLSFSRRQVVALLEHLMPYLRIKKVKAQDVLRYRKLYPSLSTSPLAANYRERDRIKTHCKRGHPMTPENVYCYNGNRQCKICAYATHQRWRQRIQRERKERKLA